MDTVKFANTGREIKSNGLRILIPDNFVTAAHEILRNAVTEANDPDSDVNACTDITLWPNEITRLLGIMRRIQDDANFDLFQYLNLTKAGKFALNQDPLIAESKIAYGGLRDGAGKNFFDKYVLQMRLVREYATADDFIYGRPIPNFRKLVLTWGKESQTNKPVFDENNVPAKPVITKTKNLKDSDVKPGWLYEDKSGKQWLCLTGIHIASDYVTKNPDNTEKSHPPESVYGRKKPYLYIRWSEALATAMTAKQTLNELCHAMNTTGRNVETWLQSQRVSYSLSPKKFVKEINQVLDLTKTVDERIKGPWQPYTNHPDAPGVIWPTHFRYDVIVYKNNTATGLLNDA